MKVWVFGLIGQKTLGLDNPNLFLMFFLITVNVRGKVLMSPHFQMTGVASQYLGFFLCMGHLKVMTNSIGSLEFILIQHNFLMFLRFPIVAELMSRLVLD